MKETFPQHPDDIDPAMIDKMSKELKNDQEKYRQEETLEDEKMEKVAEGPGEIYDFAYTDKSPDLPPEEPEELDERDIVPENVEDQDEIPESGLMSKEDLGKWLITTTDKTALRENLATRDEAIRSYEDLLVKAPLRSERRAVLHEHIQEQLDAKHLIEARLRAVEAVEAEQKSMAEAQKPKGFLARARGWFSRK
jgi:hypothetical protein